jgi:hypothetical protein
MLKHEVMAADEWHDNMPQDLINVSQCIQIVFVVRSLCLPIPWPQRYHGALCSQRWHQQTVAHTTPSAWVQLKPGFVHEEHTSVCQWPSTVSICPLMSVTTPNCSQVKSLVRTTSTQMSFPEVTDNLCRNSSVVQTHSFIGCLGGWSQTISQVKRPNVEVLGLRGYT